MSRWRLGPPMLQKSVTWKDSLTATRTRSMMTRRRESGPSSAAERVGPRRRSRAVQVHVETTQENGEHREVKTACRDRSLGGASTRHLLNPDGENR